MLRKKSAESPYEQTPESNPSGPLSPTSESSFEKGRLTNIAGKTFSLMSVASVASPLIFLMPQVAVPLSLGYLFGAAAGGITFGLAGSWLNHKYRQAVESDGGDYSGRARYSDGGYRRNYSSSYRSGGYYGNDGFWSGYMIGSLFDGGGSSGSRSRSSSSNGDAGKAMAVALLVVAAAAAFYCSGKSVYDNFIKAGPVVAPPEALNENKRIARAPGPSPHEAGPINGPIVG